MPKALIAGNWKMNLDRQRAGALAEAVGKAARAANSERADMLLIPPYPYLEVVAAALADAPVALGAQDVSAHAEGAYTGEVSGQMLADCGCSHVLVGHSERRSGHHESNQQVADKFAAALSAGLVPVLCVGETLDQRQAGQTEAVVLAQLDTVLDQVGIAGFADAVVAYEPVWAIGTGETATPAQAQAVHALIRSRLRQADGTIGGQVQVLYGGSMKPENAAELLACEDIDGGLIGGASLQAESFLAIYQAALDGG